MKRKLRDHPSWPPLFSGPAVSQSVEGGHLKEVEQVDESTIKFVRDDGAVAFWSGVDNPDFSKSVVEQLKNQIGSPIHDIGDTVELDF